jgi:putative membrane protein
MKRQRDDNMTNESKQELAEDRTDWALERTLLAKDRTFSAWVRTGIAAVAAGLATARLLDSVDFPWIARTVGIILTVTGALIFALGYLSYRKSLIKIADKGVRGWPLWIKLLITIALILSTALCLLLIFQE